MTSQTMNITREKARLGAIAGLFTVLLMGSMMLPTVTLAGGKGDRVQKTSKHDFATTVQELKKAVSAQNLVILKDYNVQMMVKMVGVKADPATTLAVFHPRYGKVLYENDKDAFEMVPIRIIVQQRGKKVIVGYQKPSAIFSGYDVPKKTAQELDRLFEGIVNSITK